MKAAAAMVFVFAFVSNVPSVAAQNIGTFRWQFAPYCNAVTLNVVQQGSVYALAGYDELCGATTRPPASGTAHLNPDGSIGMALAITRPNGFSTLTTIRLPAGGFSGTWSDNYGTSGTFVFSPPASPVGTPRPITIRGTYAIEFEATSLNSVGVSAFSFGQTLPTVPIAVAANLISVGGTPTANCPGSVPLAQAAPGHLCVYTRAIANVDDRCIISTAGGHTCDTASQTGAAIYIRTAGPGRTYSIGVWAVTLPQ